ncbi:hypothetical protein HPB47_016562 [Ixodes persulcatus]|uniref:Uncharacterized protein n=1 Tax=Ixodes persulcatus TaxID=34615 RepID=A0AC60QQM2_IXOPE|nr:hypothetical protein HPB47_016562 [Ixodes persulcatus]
MSDQPPPPVLDRRRLFRASKSASTDVATTVSGLRRPKAKKGSTGSLRQGEISTPGPTYSNDTPARLSSPELSLGMMSASAPIAPEVGTSPPTPQLQIDSMETNEVVLQTAGPSVSATCSIPQTGNTASAQKKPTEMYKVNIRPREQMDFHVVTTREIETAIFALISATAYQGLNRHKPSNSATAYVSTQEDAFQLTKLLTIQHQGNRAVQVQAYLASGPNVHRCVVRGVVPDHPDQDILPDLRTPSHRILAARRLGKGDTYLLTVQAIVKATGKLQQPPRTTATSQHSSQHLHGASREFSSLHRPKGAKNMPPRTPRRDQETRSPSAAENVNTDEVTAHLLSVAKALDTLTSQIAAMQSSLDAVLMILQQWMSRHLEPNTWRYAAAALGKKRERAVRFRLLTAPPPLAAYFSRGIVHRRLLTAITPGKAAIYVKDHLQHAPIDLSKWCTSRQEVVAVLVRTRYNLGVQAGFPRGHQVYDRFTDRGFHLLNLPGPTRLGNPSNAPDLTWWRGTGHPAWRTEDDTWGSDHFPIIIKWFPTASNRLRKQVQVTDWNKLRSSLNITAQNPETVQRAIKEAMLECTTTTTVHCDQPTPDPHILRLWQQRLEAVTLAALYSDDHQLQDEASHVAAKARRHEKRLTRQRWLDWCASLSNPKRPEALWRTFHAIERPRQAEGRTGNIQLRLGLTDDEFAARAADTFFPRHASRSVPRPVTAMPDTTGITTPFTLAELQDAIESASRRSAPGHDGLPYEVYKNLEGEAVKDLLAIINKIWEAGELPTSWKHSIVVPIPKPGKAPTGLTALRPISLTPTICKIYERMMAKRISWSITGEPTPVAEATKTAPAAHHVTLSTRTQSAGNWRFRLPGRRNTLHRVNKFISGPRHCKSCAPTSRFPEKWLFDALCYQILACQICCRALYDCVVELPGFYEDAPVHAKRGGARTALRVFAMGGGGGIVGAELSSDEKPERSAGAAIAAQSGRSDRNDSASSEYQIILPPLPTGPTVLNTVFLHADVRGRPYRVEDFRDTLSRLALLPEVLTLGAYQMNHVWAVTFRSPEGKRKIITAGDLVVKGRRCVVVDPANRDVRVKIHWLLHYVPDDEVRVALAPYGQVIDVGTEKWRVEGIMGCGSMTRTAVIRLKPGIGLEDLPHQLRIAGGPAHVVAPGRPPLCLPCQQTGHIRRDCRVPKCATCHRFGHDPDHCIKTYATATCSGG